MGIPSEDICAQVYFRQESVIIADKDDRLLCELLLFVCVMKNAQTNCQCVSSQLIASKTQETHSCGNTVGEILNSKKNDAETFQSTNQLIAETALPFDFFVGNSQPDASFYLY